MSEFSASGPGSEEIDPATEAEIREAMSGVEDAEPVTVEPAAPVDREAELTADLQRLQAEYVNYRKRVERDKGQARETAIGDVLLALLPVLDDFGRAAEHGELTGAFKSVADAVDGVVRRLGLEVFGAVGEEFDPALHEALTHESAEADGPVTTVVTAVYQPGYRHAGRVLRAARVAVQDQPVG